MWYYFYFIFFPKDGRHFKDGDRSGSALLGGEDVREILAVPHSLRDMASSETHLAIDTSYGTLERTSSTGLEGPYNSTPDHTRAAGVGRTQSGRGSRLSEFFRDLFGGKERDEYGSGPLLGSTNGRNAAMAFEEELSPNKFARSRG